MRERRRAQILRRSGFRIAAQSRSKITTLASLLRGNTFTADIGSFGGLPVIPSEITEVSWMWIGFRLYEKARSILPTLLAEKEETLCGGLQTDLTFDEITKAILPESGF